MADPENQTLHLLREMREQIDTHRAETREGFESMSERLKNLQQAMIGESVLGRYTVAEVEQRLENIEYRLAALEKKR
ncbi:MAG: hypothetical protein Q8M24_14015 [Pseudolabrys sp.]|nr:hypothetical protein [Pseudolabrys sp.]